MFLLDVTRIVNYIVLALALWLGLYIVTRSPRRLIAWLTGLTLWSIASLSLNVLLALDPPPEVATLPVWFQFFLPVWQAERIERALSGWLNGWSIIPAIVLWHHITILMRPGPLTHWRRIRIWGGYALLIIAAFTQAYTPWLFTIVEGDPLYMPVLEPGPLYWPFLLLSLLYVGMCLTNLIRSAKAAPTAMPRKQFIILTVATVVAGLTGPFAIAGSVLNLQVPIVILSFLLGCAVVLIGVGVANYGALVKGRTIRRDFIYNGVIVLGVTALYLTVTWFSVTAYQVPGVAFVFVFMLAIITHSLVDVARRGLDSIFFRQDTRQLRADLQRLVHIAGEEDSLENKLSVTLESLCIPVRATFGLIILFEADGIRLAASYRWNRATVLPLSKADLMADDVVSLEPGHFPPPLAETALLIPLYSDTGQLGVVLLGRPVNGINYLQDEIEFLLYPSDRIADAIRSAEREAEYLRQVAQLVAEGKQPALSVEREKISVKEVENAFRHLTDFAGLGQSPLANLKLVSSRLTAETVTHVDKGKGVYSVLVEALGKLRPDGGTPSEPPGREWYPYLILQQAYLEDIPNRDIMLALYISEGTFNRTRRSALRSVTRILTEMEAGLQTTM